MDNDRYGGVLTGRSGFFDLGGITPIALAPAPGEVSCSVSVNADNVPVVSYSGSNVSVVNIRRNDRWIETNAAGTGTYNDTSAVRGVAYSYVVRTRPRGVVVDVACSPATITF